MGFDTVKPYAASRTADAPARAPANWTPGPAIHSPEMPASIPALRKQQAPQGGRGGLLETRVVVNHPVSQ